MCAPVDCNRKTDDDICVVVVVFCKRSSNGFVLIGIMKKTL